MLLRALCRGDVPQGSRTLDRLLRNGDGNPRFQCVGSKAGKLKDTDCLFGTDVEGLQGRPAEEDSPKPDGKIRGVEIRAKGCAVAGDLDGVAAQGVANEVGEGEMAVERKAGAGEGVAACDLELDGGLLGVERAHELRGALAFAVCGGWAEDVGRAGIVFRDVRERGGLL